MKKIRNVLRKDFFKKTHSGPILGLLLPKNLKNKIFPAKTSLKSILSLYSIVTLLKNQKHFEYQFFIKLEKHHFGPLKQDFSDKKKNSRSVSREQQTNRRRQGNVMHNREDDVTYVAYITS